MQQNLNFAINIIVVRLSSFPDVEFSLLDTTEKSPNDCNPRMIVCTARTIMVLKTDLLRFNYTIILLDIVSLKCRIFIVLHMNVRKTKCAC